MASDGNTPRNADHNDTWVRHLLFTNEIRRNGKIHRQFFKKFFRPPGSGKEKPWALEISGRLLSMARHNVETVATATAEKLKEKNPHSSAKFRGLLYQQVKIIREIEEGLYDVFHEPNYKDTAHANFVRWCHFPTLVDGEIDPEFFDKLIEIFKVVKPDSKKLEELLESADKKN